MHPVQTYDLVIVGAGSADVLMRQGPRWAGVKHADSFIRTRPAQERPKLQCHFSSASHTKAPPEKRRLKRPDPYSGPIMGTRPVWKMDNDEEMIADIRERAGTVLCPVSTCRMRENDTEGLVNAWLQGHGSANLRMTDVSVFPAVTSGNSNAQNIMVAEKRGRHDPH